MPDGALVAGRLRAESMMTDFGVMRRPTSRTAQNADGEEVQVFEDVFSERCKVQGDSGDDPQTRTVVIGGVERPVIRGGLHLPIGAPAVERGWVFEVTRVADLTDVRLLGKKYWIDADPVESRATARRLHVVEV